MCIICTVSRQLCIVSYVLCTVSYAYIIYCVQYGMCTVYILYGFDMRVGYELHMNLTGYTLRVQFVILYIYEEIKGTRIQSHFLYF